MLGDTVILLSMFISSGDVKPTFAFCCCILVCNNIYYLIPWRRGALGLGTRVIPQSVVPIVGHVWQSIDDR